MQSCDRSLALQPTLAAAVGGIPSNVGADVGASVFGIASSHVMETPAASPEESDVKRMNMLPDVAAWMGGIAAPLKLPLSAPFADVPS
jgi:ABC-type branched-subunit amino acid transport system permease subunit